MCTYIHMCNVFQSAVRETKIYFLLNAYVGPFFASNEPSIDYMDDNNIIWNFPWIRCDMCFHVVVHLPLTLFLGR